MKPRKRVKSDPRVHKDANPLAALVEDPGTVLAPDDIARQQLDTWTVTPSRPTGSVHVDCNCGGTCGVCQAYERMKKKYDDELVREVLEFMIGEEK